MMLEKRPLIFSRRAYTCPSAGMRTSDRVQYSSGLPNNSHMDGYYNIDTNHIRALAIQCHALDLQFDRLFNKESICGDSVRIYETYTRLLSAGLLNLAISIRISLREKPQYFR